MKKHQSVLKKSMHIAFVFLFVQISSFAQWSQQAINTPTSISGTFFTSVDTGYAVGTRVFKSTDGGVIWNPLYTPEYDIGDIDFISNNKGYAISDAISRIYKTSDAGLTWDSLDLSSGSFRSIDFITPDSGFICGTGTGNVATIWRTTDSGASWVSNGNIGGGASSQVSDIQMLNSTVGFACGYNWNVGNGLFFKTIDGGNTWTPQTISILPHLLFFRSVHFIDTLNGYISGNYNESGTGASISVVYRTTDGGINWTSQNIGIGNLNIIQFVSDSVGFIGGADLTSSGCGNSVIYKTTDTGATWLSENTPGIYGIGSMHFLDENNGYAFESCVGAGSFGALLKYGTVSNNVCFASYSVAVDSATSVFTLTIDPVTVFNTQNYFWDFGNGTTSYDATPSFSSAIDTVLNVCMTAYMATGDSCTYCHLIGIDSLGNIVRDQGFTVNVVDSSATTNIFNINENHNYILYPNPNDGEFTITQQSDSQQTQISIFDVLGKTILTTELKEKNIHLNLNDINSGIYLIELINSQGVSRMKFYKR